VKLFFLFSHVYLFHFLQKNLKWRRVRRRVTSSSSSFLPLLLLLLLLLLVGIIVVVKVFVVVRRETSFAEKHPFALLPSRETKRKNHCFGEENAFAGTCRARRRRRIRARKATTEEETVSSSSNNNNRRELRGRKTA